MTAQRVLEVARSQLGVVESPANSNRQKFGAAYGTNGVAWCAIFTWWVFQQAGDGGLHPKTAYTPALADWYRARGRWSTAPRVGSLVLFDFPGDNLNRISHVGIVEAVNRDGTVVTIEGNTSAGTSGSQRDGGGVYRRTRRTGIVGYGHPAYTSPTPTPTTSGGAELNAEETKMLREIHGQLNNLFPSRVDFPLLGQGDPGASRVRDTAAGYAVNADARSYETRELVRALRTELAAVARLVQAQQAAIDTVTHSAGGATPEQIKDAVAAALRDNVARVEISVAGRSA